MKAGRIDTSAPSGPRSGSHQIFYSVFLPVGAVANLVLGLIVLRDMQPESEFGWLQLATGAFCCMVAGWLAAAAWSRFYWSRHMSNQLATWGRISGTFFAWLEEAPLPAESLRRLKTSLEEVVPRPTEQ